MATYLYPPVSVTTLPPLGGATAANQVLEIADLDAIKTSTASADTKLSSQATASKQDALLAELQLKADLTETQPVSIAGTVTVTGGLTDTQLRASAVPVTANAGTNLNTSALSLEATQLLIKAKTDNLDVALSTVAKDVTLLASNVLIGAVTETAPATDTASSALNGRLQRIAQRITSLIAILPTALGQGTMATSFKVVLPSDQSAIPVTPGIISGTITSVQKSVGLTEVRATVSGSAPSASRKSLKIKPSKNNSGAIYLIPTGGTISNGMEIIGPDRLEFEKDASDYYLISDTTAQVVEIVEVV